MNTYDITKKIYRSDDKKKGVRMQSRRILGCNYLVGTETGATVPCLLEVKPPAAYGYTEHYKEIQDPPTHNWDSLQNKKENPNTNNHSTLNNAKINMDSRTTL